MDLVFGFFYLRCRSGSLEADAKWLVCRRFIRWHFGEKEAQLGRGGCEVVPAEAVTSAVGSSEAGMTLQSSLFQAGDNNWFGDISDMTFQTFILNGHLVYRYSLPDGFSVA